MKGKKNFGSISVRLLLVLALCLAYVWFPDVMASAEPQAKDYTPAQVLLNQHFERPLRARISGGNYYVLDARTHRLLVLDSGENFVRQIGRFGTGPEELSDPTDFAISPEQKIYIFEAGNKRLTILDPNGVRIGGFPALELSLGIAVNSRSEIILNQPACGALFTVYASDGSVRRSFGALRSPPSGFTAHTGHYDPGETYNRVNFALDSADNIYAAWWFDPRVQKYSPDGQLLWEVELSGKHVDHFRQMARENSGYYKYNGATVILSGIAYDASAQLVYVLLPSRTLYILDAQGNQLGRYYDRRDNVWPFNSVTASEDGKLLFIDTSGGVYSVRGLYP